MTEITVDILGGETTAVTAEEPTAATVLESLGYTSQEATVLVDNKPVPPDYAISTSNVSVLRLISGG